MAKLFLSYRRSDTGPYADLLAKRLARFQFEAIFLDREAIGLSDNFADQIRESLSECSALLVLIGKDWLNASDAEGRRRLDDPADWVRREIGIAMSLKLQIVPVLFDSPRRPSIAELPSEIATLAIAVGYDINGNYFDRDADELARRLENMLVSTARSTGPNKPTAPAGHLRQIQLIWIAWSVIALAGFIAPVQVPGLPPLLGLFPGSMAFSGYLWWLYLQGKQLRRVQSTVP